MILDLHRQGLSVSAIARQMGVDRSLPVRTYIAEKGWSRRPTRSARRRPASSIASNRICASAWRPIPPLRPRGVCSVRSRSAAFPAATASCGTACAISARPQCRIRGALRDAWRRRKSTSSGSRSSSSTSRTQTHCLAVLDGAWLLPPDLGAVRPAPGSAKRPALPHRRSGGDRWRAAYDPLRSHEDGGHRRGRRRARCLQPSPRRSRPPLRLSAAGLPALSGENEKAKSSGRSDTPARTSSSAACSAIWTT